MAMLQMHWIFGKVIRKKLPIDRFANYFLSWFLVQGFLAIHAFVILDSDVLMSDLASL